MPTHYRHHRKLVKVGKLTDDEARLMGLDGQRALYKMLRCPEEQEYRQGDATLDH